MENSEFDTDKVSDSIFDPEISQILAEMETQSKHCSILTEKFGITPETLQAKLSYLVEYNFVKQSGEENNIMYSVNSEKLADFMESSHDYKNVEDNLTKMDSYLN